LRRYWFGKGEFSAEWFSRHVSGAVAALDERYHPEDHVDVSIEHLFEFVCRNEAALKRLIDRVVKIDNAPIPDTYLKQIDDKHPLDDLAAITKAVDAITAIKLDFSVPPWHGWTLARWKRLSEELVSAVGKLRTWSWQERSNISKDNSDKRSRFEYLSHSLNKLGDAAESLQTLLGSRYLEAEQIRAAIIEGRAGTGKSHLLAKIAERALQEERPVILLLGQQFNDQPIWTQISSRLGLGAMDSESLLQALAAASEAIRKRGVILIDAINEGAGPKIWRNEIAPFLAQVQRYPSLACFVSCRSEYVPYSIPNGVLSSVPRFEIRGFETQKEQLEAAEVYMDKRGISRPGVPWLAPEFVNPLFLRSACLALAREGKSEFPRGLTGTKAILAFYVKSVGRNLGAGRDGTDELVPGTAKALRALTTKMATKRKDYVSKCESLEVTNGAFADYPAPQGMNWLDVLHRSGLLRYDPSPEVGGDALVIPDDVVRFSFQRFQDHLIAEVLLSETTNPVAALKNGGTLGFIHAEGNINWEWQGLVEALSIQLPERFGIELVDALPEGAPKWWRIWQIPDAFTESIRWRDKKAFNKRTLELFNLLPRANLDRLSILIELSASVDHPWNADFLHDSLLKRGLIRRDQTWTNEISNSDAAEDSIIGRLIDWCLVGQSVSSHRDTRRLCAITLCWLLCSTNRYIRDKATKALSSIFLTQDDVFPELVQMFEEADDLYLHERLIAAAYGACCIDPSAQRLKNYAAAIFKSVFKTRPPRSILLRDYARGIIELCTKKATLPPSINLKKCLPPYQSPVPNLRVTEAQVKRAAKRAGDETILHSCSSGLMGDFGSYEITPRTGRFTAVQLTKSQPVTSREKSDQFEAEVVAGDPERMSRYKTLRDAAHLPLMRSLIREEKTKVSQAELTAWAERIVSAEQRFLALLSNGESQRYKTDAAPYLGIRGKAKPKEPPEVDLPGAMRWVAKTAYEIGWTKERFPHDTSRSFDYSRDRPRIERIGKKYQWIALDDLLCRLADNYWIGSDWGTPAKAYNNPLDIGFERDIDPTILSPAASPGLTITADIGWGSAPLIAIGETAERDLSAWPLKGNRVKSLPSLIRKSDGEGKKWAVLYEHRSAKTKYEDKQPREHGLRLQEWYFLMCVFVSKMDREKLVDALKAKKHIDVTQWDPHEYTDGPFLREAPWRDTWSQQQWWTDVSEAPDGLKIAFPVFEYHWESHLDSSMPKGARARVPAPWLVTALELKPDSDDANVWHGPQGSISFIHADLDEGTSVLLREDLLDQLMQNNNLACVWLFVGERGAWPGGSNKKATWRRSEGLCWLDRKNPTCAYWQRDNGNRKAQRAPRAGRGSRQRYLSRSKILT